MQQRFDNLNLDSGHFLEVITSQVVMATVYWMKNPVGFMHDLIHSYKSQYMIHRILLIIHQWRMVLHSAYWFQFKNIIQQLNSDLIFLFFNYLIVD